MYEVQNMAQALSRSESREVAFRIIFAMGNGTVNDSDAWNLALDGKTAPAPEKQYIEQVLNTFLDLRGKIDARISEHLQKWTLDRLRQTDLAVLRLASAEMMLGSVPTPVIINEAVNLAKKYGDAQSGSFVNGLLAKLAE